MGSRRIESLTDLVSYGIKVRASCSCGREAILEPTDLIKNCVEHRQSAKLSAVYRRLRCADCGGQPEWVGTT